MKVTITFNTDNAAFHDPMTAETLLHGWDHCHWRFVCIAVAIEALDLEFTGVTAVAEEDRLRWPIVVADHRVRVEGEVPILEDRRGGKRRRSSTRSLSLKGERDKRQPG